MSSIYLHIGPAPCRQTKSRRLFSFERVLLYQYSEKWEGRQQQEGPRIIMLYQTNRDARHKYLVKSTGVKKSPRLNCYQNSGQLSPQPMWSSALRLTSFSVIVLEGATRNGRRLVPRQRVVTLWNIFCKGGVPMLTIESLITVLSFGLACFELGYTLGNKNAKK